MAKRYRPVHVQPLAVRTAVTQKIAHTDETSLVHPLARIQGDDAGDTAHGSADH